MSKFAQKIIRWQLRDGRHDLPWQNTRDPYRIWISEIMLQQTQVAAVIEYYERFILRFPDIKSLASTPIDDVMPYWAGLGYYARARNLHKAAGLIEKNFDGIFPNNFDDAWSLPGIGRSTAAAICAFAYGESRPILDGNVKRVIARYFDVKGDIRSKPIEDAMWSIAEREAPRKQIEIYIQGQMDLGATLCSRSAPKCLLCPLQDACVAHLEGRTNELPWRRSKKEARHRQTQMLVMLFANEVLIERRPPTGIWGGLWSLPEIAIDADAAAIAKARFGVSLARGRRPQPLTQVEHGFTHYSLTIYPVEIAVGKRVPCATEPGTMWINLGDTQNAALPAPVKKILRNLQDN
ncbi:MAG: A/G-specific adenine glycosylase [Pseudomonadota bacterium]